MMKTKSKPTTEQIREDFRSQLQKETAKQLRGINAVVEQRIRESADAIILNAIGMTERWGSWEVDHCNGRRSAIAEEIGRHARAQVERIVSEWSGQFKPDQKTLANIKREFNEHYDRTARELAREAAITQARKDFEEIMKAAGTEDE